VRHAQRVEQLVDELHLAAEVFGRLVPGGLVVGVFLVPEGRLGTVEGDRHVCRLLIAQDVGQHRGEPVDRLGVLTVGGHEVGVFERVERAIGQGMPVKQQQARAAGGHITLRHTESLVADPDRKPELGRLEASP
jgi:hypothetical protein